MRVVGVELVPVVGANLVLLDALVLLHAAIVLLHSLEMPVVLHAVIVRTSMRMCRWPGEATARSGLAFAGVISKLEGRRTQVKARRPP